MDEKTVSDSFPSSEGNILVWNTCSETEVDRSTQAQAISASELSWETRRRGRSFSSSASSKHPLLAKLKEIEEDESEDVKHSVYTVHVLIQKQIRDYAFAVEDVIELLRSGSGRILDNVAFWRGRQEDDNYDDEAGGPTMSPNSKSKSSKPSWMSFTFTTKNGNELDITQIGRNIVQISETMKKLQENDKDTLIFWTSEQRDVLFKLLVNLAKDVVKFRRKLQRIRDSLGERVKNVRRTAIQCECEITGNIVPTEIYYQWVKEDAEVYNSKISSENVSSQCSLPKPTGLTSTLRKTAQNLISCFQSDGKKAARSNDDDDNEEEDSNASTSNAHGDSSTFVKNKQSFLNGIASLPVKVYQIRKEVEYLLHKDASDISQADKSSICDPSLESFVAKCVIGPGRNAGPAPVRSKGSDKQGALDLDEVWAAKPSQKYLKAIASNIAPKQKFPTPPHYIYDRVESKIKEAFKAERGLPYPLSEVEVFENANDSATKIKSDYVPPLISTKSSAPASSKNKRSLDSAVPLTSFATSVAATVSGSESAEEEVVEGITEIPQRLLNEEMMKHITTSKQIIGGIHDIVTETMWAIRDVERKWLSTRDNSSRNLSGSFPFPNMKILPSSEPKELYQLLDFIVETAKLTNRPEFASRIYPEDKDEIVSVLDPVLKELTTCYMNVYVLHNLVMVDGKYLQELVAGFPKGNLVVRDWVSDPSIDEELHDVETVHHGLPMKEFHVDVDELFA